MRFFLLIAFVLILSTLGCSDSTSEQNTTNNKIETKVMPPNPLANAETIEKAGVKAVIASWKKTEEFIKSQKGKIVVVDFWATWCDPCTREFPHLVALQKKYPKQIVCVSFNLNYDGSEDTAPKASSKEILNFLVKHPSALTNIISSTPDEEFYDATDIASIPVVYVYNADGTRNKIFQDDRKYGEDGFSYKKHITPLIDKLVKEQKNKQSSK